MLLQYQENAAFESTVGLARFSVGLLSKMEQSIPYVNVAEQHKPIVSELLEAIESVLKEGQFILGEPVEAFEQQFAELCGVRYAVGVNSGTDALVLALRAVGVGPGDEVITVPNSFVSSTTCICLVGARPVFVDVGGDYNIDPAKIAEAVTARTKAILPVHLTGRPCAMDSIMKLARAKGLYVIEDCAQAVTAEYYGQRIGSFGTIGCFSLHPLKTLSACGDGGVLTTKDQEIYERLRIMRNIGLRDRDDLVMWSSNSRLDTIQAAILLVKLRYLDDWTELRRANARHYMALLSGIPQMQVPSDSPHMKSVYHTFVVQAEDRAELSKFLAERKIGSAIHYPVPIHLTRVGQEMGFQEGNFPVAEGQARRVLSLPVYQSLLLSQIERICENIHEFYSAR